MDIDVTKYRLHIDRDACIPCDLCNHIFPEFFKRGEQIVCGWAYQHNYNRIDYAVKNCPEKALHFDVIE